MASDSSKVKVGEMPCLDEDCSSHDANRPVYVRMNRNGTLSYSCECCGVPGVAKNGTNGRENWIKRMKKNGTWTGPGASHAAEPAKPEHIQAKPAAPTPAPAAKPKPAFSLGDL